MLLWDQLLRFAMPHCKIPWGNNLFGVGLRYKWTISMLKSFHQLGNGAVLDVVDDDGDDVDDGDDGSIPIGCPPISTPHPQWWFDRLRFALYSISTTTTTTNKQQTRGGVFDNVKIHAHHQHYQRIYEPSYPPCSDEILLSSYQTPYEYEPYHG